MLKNKFQMYEATESNKLIMIMSEIKPDYTNQYKNIKELFN